MMPSEGNRASPHRLPLRDPIYEITRDRAPVLTVRSGTTITIETEDAFTHQISKPGDRRDRSMMPFSNPLSGPIAVDGAEPGDALRIRILRIEPLNGQCATYAIPHPLVMPHLGARADDQTRICAIDGDGIHWSEILTLPYKPMIGCIATAPALGAPTSGPAGDYGGNLDLPEVTAGSVLWLPVFVSGALLYVGDCHAAQGAGELCAAAMEMRGAITLTIDLCKRAMIPGPRVETESDLLAVAVARNLEESIALAYSRLALWLEADYGWNRWEAYSLLTQVGRLSVGYFSAGTVAAGMEKKLALAGRQA